MALRTRKRVMVFLVLGLVTLPAEALLLPIARTPNPEEAAMAWAQGQSTARLQSAGVEIDAYPPVYRRAIMRSLDPHDRSTAWRTHLRRYLRQNRSLAPHQADVIDEAIELASSDAFTPPLAPDIREQITTLYNRALTSLGPKVTEELFVTLGPKTLKRANALPVTQQLADRIRSWQAASAEYVDCNCNIDIDTCDISWDPWLQCSELYTCKFVLKWPMCGPFWSWACTGWCKIIRWPDFN
jgi:hypothetical protein